MRLTRSFVTILLLWGLISTSMPMSQISPVSLVRELSANNAAGMQADIDVDRVNRQDQRHYERPLVSPYLVSSNAFADSPVIGRSESAPTGLVSDAALSSGSVTASDWPVLVGTEIGSNRLTLAGGGPGFDYAHFTSSTDLALVGSAIQLDELVRLNLSDQNQVGAAWHPVKQFLQEGFESVFQFRITETYKKGADGFAFVVQNSHPHALGSGGGGLGYTYLHNSLAVEFDTWRNKEIGDPNANHISIQTRGSEANDSDAAFSLASAPDLPDFSDGAVHTARIRYVPGLFEVYLNDFTLPVISTAIWLTETLELDYGRAWIGFTGSSGGSWENHDILSWSFSPRPLAVSRAGNTAPAAILERETPSRPSPASLSMYQPPDVHVDYVTEGDDIYAQYDYQRPVSVSNVGYLHPRVYDTRASVEPAATTATVWMVTSRSDSGSGSLREALMGAHSGDTIRFDPTVFPPTHPMTIALLSRLPAVSQGNLTIDASDAGVVLDGQYLSEGHGLYVISDGNAIHGLQIIRFPWKGVELAEGAKYNLLGGDWTMGQAARGQGNVITLNREAGVAIRGTGTMSNTIRGNLVGLSANGAPDFRVQALLASPDYAHDQTLFLATRYDGIWRSTDRGESWSPVNDGLTDFDIASLTASPEFATDQVLFAGAARGDIFKAVDGGSTWSPVYESDGGYHPVRALSLSPAYAIDQTVFAVVANAGLLVSKDGGLNWDNVAKDPVLESVSWSLRGVAVSPDYANDRTLLTFSWNRVFRSRDGGDSWELLTDQVEELSALAFSPAYREDRTIMAARWRCDEDSSTVFWRSVDGGDTWEATGAPSYKVCVPRILVFSPDYAADQMVVASDAWGGLYRSTDLGSSWTKVLSATNNLVAFSPDFAQDRTLFASHFPGRLLMSIDGGDHWSSTEANLTEPGNGGEGIVIHEGAQRNVIGGSETGHRNIISHNVWAGVVIKDEGTMYNHVLGNFVGTDAGGTRPLGNQTEGIVIMAGATYNHIGGSASGSRNVIGANSLGISIRDGDTMSNTVQGNYVGLDVSGLAELGNRGNGIELQNGTRYNTIGGPASAARNVTGGNEDSGIGVYNSYSNTIAGNYVGLGVDGDTLFGNHGNGVVVAFSSHNRIEGNVISGNEAHGLGVWEYSTHNVVTGNTLGLDAAGNLPRGNTAAGVLLGNGATYNQVGGTVASDRNVIGANTWCGVYVGGDVGQADASYNQISGNYIGLNAAGERAVGNGSGIILRGTAKLNVVGGSTAAEGNLITGNLDHGVHIYDSTAMNNTVSGNHIGPYATATRDFRVRVLAMSPAYAQDRTVFAGTHYDGVWRTTNGGVTWSPVSTLPISNVTALALSPGFGTDRTILAGSDTGLLYQSTDNGLTWARVDDDNIAVGHKITAIRFSPDYVDDLLVFIVVEYTGIFASTDGGLTWQVHHGDIEDPWWVSGLVFSSDFASDRTMFVYGSDRVLKSQDAGATWLTATTQISNIQALTIAPNYADENTIWIGTDSCEEDKTRLWRSTDGGESFLPLPDTPGHAPCHLRTVAASPNYAVDRTLFAGDEWSGVYRSQDSGLTWQRVLDGHFNRNLAISPAYNSDRTIWVGRYTGEILISANAGQSWRPLDAGLTRPGNHRDGILISDGANGNVIGGSTPGERNVISNNGSAGVRITGAATHANVIRGNYIGTTPGGTATLGNNTEGVAITDGSHTNRVGGSSEGDRNVIGGNDAGLLIHGTGTNDNVVVGNFIGVDPSGTQALGNRSDGITLASGAQNNRIGSSMPGDRNVIGGNEVHGVGVWHSGTTSNTIAGNYIGVDISGTRALGNRGNGVVIGDGAHHNQIGGSAVGDRNIISGNWEHGVGIWNTGSEFNTVIGNYVGVDVSGNVRLGNGASGIALDHGASHNRVGGARAAERNVVGDNRWDGISLWNAETVSNTITGNYIGIGADGLTQVGNYGSGVGIVRAQFNVFGGGTSGERNVISGNADAGITLSEAATAHNVIRGNYIGLTANGVGVLANRHGISCVWQAHSNTIQDNYIGGNEYHGIQLNGCNQTTILGNYIGTTVADAHLGNGDTGISLINNARDSIIGPGNVIAYNGVHGIGVWDASVRNTLTRNLIYQNGQQATKLGRGGNTELPAPILTTRTATRVSGRASGAYQTLEIYAGDSLGRWLYRGSAQADAEGYFTYSEPSGFYSDVLLATATDAEGNTSEFSALATCVPGRLCNGGFEPHLDHWVTEGLVEQVTPGLRSIYAVRSMQTLGALHPPTWSGLQQTITVVGGQGYVFEGHLKWQQAAQLHVQAQWLDAVGQTLTTTQLLAPTYGDSLDWQRYSVPVVAPIHATSVRIVLRHGLSQQGINVSNSTVWADNLSFAPRAFATGSAVSIPTTPTTLTSWSAVALTVDVPSGTAMAASVLDINHVPLPGLADIPLESGDRIIDLHSVDPQQYPALRLQLHLTSTLAGVSPALSHWQLSWLGDHEGDAYEPDDTCLQARAISTDGTVQRRTFHRQADEDWVVFQGATEATYRIEAYAAPESSADVSLELYDQCAGLPLESQSHMFTPGVRLDFTATTSSLYYLRWTNQDPTVSGADVAYHLSVKELRDEPTPGALVIAAGRYAVNDLLQSKIHYAAEQLYQVFQAYGYPAERVYYLATDPTRQGYDAQATAANLQAAITTWADALVGPERPFTLYLVDHGKPNGLYLDRPFEQMVSPAQIDAWLNELEAAHPGLKVNVIIEACHSGSFIRLPQSVSKPGRVVISSTGVWNLAYASSQGAVFSDHFTAGLYQGQSLFQSFQNASWATQNAFPFQTPWLDDDGDGLPNQSGDGQVAAARGFAFAGTLTGDVWPPHIFATAGPEEITQGRGVISAEVRDDEQVQRVWAVIYPPSYRPPESGEELVSEVLPTIVLQAQGNDQFAATYTGFDELGVYRVVIYAEDDGGREARPVSIEVRTGWGVFLPLVARR